ncbi:ImmA/IrrE family metallo-endopeptidase [Clostridium butyricum]|uniref:IrrE N-terminal-like domain-containing protein n=1 Tax=Clostridium butyricum E4 str. BoNT E BL5262 TaxID=632245 RepID=C4II69_CLOBU|nr:ImmA/IrrE family metallo-endopeptidase [Clostridium butyricum]EDT75823.1 conserved hypothetical protein [Clostridium butyricum 5521]EEP53855.1 conserved hypothetical protein [Clostridium butyricum E4 str. BoNT E BL5262]NFL33130.1 ImmA/IrrE family metallo-endopeptidase [Clostridium butyricum]NFS20293.1 ImmA/IrrE family metallo-endopeptidase [Clostridium butyricum]
MKNIFSIFKLLSSERIILEDFNPKESDLDGIYINIPGLDPVIGINKNIIDSSRLYISTLGEELGHHFTTCGNLTTTSKTYNDVLMKAKQEQKAKVWASNFLISDRDFVHALNNCIISKDEMAEYFHVTEEIVNLKIKSIIVDEEKYINIKRDFMTKEIQYNSCLI